MSEFSYLTVQTPSEGLFKEKGSKFLSFVYPVSTEQEIKERLDYLKNKYFDAHHHCYAWVLGADRSRFRAFDDGEPGHSAGDPILGQIRSKNLTYVLIVVVRYFGGTKLGVGGLISAYRQAALAGLENNLIVERDVTERLEIRYPYSNTPDVMKMVKEFGMEILTQDFHDECTLQAAIGLKWKEKFIERVQLMNATGSDLKIHY